MSYQLIYHAPHHHPQAPLSGDAVARSRTIPRLLEQALTELSPRLHPGAGTPNGRQYSYVQVECGSTLFHVLSSLFSDETGYTAHHLALTHDEEQALRRNASRPTPPGVILALCNIGLWCTTAARERFPYIDDEPRLTAAALPEAARQPTWKRLTGHKNNARCFFTPPYDRNCLVTVPAEFGVTDILMLLHESDWLSSTRGWGKTFTTLAGPGMSEVACNRIILPADSPLCSSIVPPDTPLLAITPELEPNFGSAAQQVSASTVTTPPYRPQRQRHTDSPRSNYQPYKYAETPDAEIYNVLPAPNKWLRWGCYLGGAALLWIGFSLISGLMMDDAGKITGNIINQINTEEDALLLSRLASSTYSHDSTARHLNKFEARLRTLPATGANNNRDILLECVQRLRSAPALSTGHANNLQRLIECAGPLKMNANDLCRLYMHEATHSRPAQGWLSPNDGTELTAWHQLLAEHPSMADWLLQEPFAPYLEPLQLPTPATQQTETDGAP